MDNNKVVEFIEAINDYQCAKKLHDEEKERYKRNWGHSVGAFEIGLLEKATKKLADVFKSAVNEAVNEKIGGIINE